MLIKSSLAATVALTAVATVSAETQVEVIPIEWSVLDGNETLPLEIPQFDDQGGNRVLNSVTIETSTSYTNTLLAENLEDFAVEASDWFVQAGAFMDFWLGGEPVAILGGAFYGQLSDDMAAADGVTQSGPDTAQATFEGTINGSWNVAPGYLPTFVGTGNVEAGIYPFLDLAITAPPPLYDLWILEHEHIGTLTATYDFTVLSQPEDVNGDGSIDVDDLVEVITSWGDCPLPPSPCRADVNGDGSVNVDDLVAVILAWN